ncbi:cytochrome P450 [Mycobacterium sp. NBC_00419]|uniref:cytochrome P450 n=1 Tax=Mycobacterium sp. NBC_00419 TaxID=2975989 RepID=UPI002E1F39C2
MTTLDRRTDIEFDHHSEQYAQAYPEIYAELRTKCPVAHTSAHGGYWVVTRYEDVVAAAKDDATFASGHEVDGVKPLGVIIPPAPLPQYPIEMDPPEYTGYRKVLNPLFSPGVSKAWEPRVRRWVDVCLDQVIETGSFDLIGDLANPVPSLFTCEFVGLPIENWREYADVMHEIIYTPPAEQEDILRRYLEMMGGVWHYIDERRKGEPRDDMLGALLSADVDGEPLSDEMVFSIVNLIMAGGFDTTTAVTASALIYLADHPEQRQRLIDDPDLIPQACEEFLRYFTPQQGLARTVTKPVSIGGADIAPGERVLLSWASANRDETVFDRPDDVILDRFPNRHTTFGIGIHRCLGSHIARLELITMVSQVLERMPDYKVDHNRATQYPTIGIINGWVNAPATFTPGTRVTDESLPG